MKITHPTEKEYQQSSYQSRYIDLVSHENVLEALQKNAVLVVETFAKIPAEKELFRYAEGKWTIREMLGHIIDTERIMMYRALCIARGEKQVLPGFEENEYVLWANFNKRSLKSMLQEYKLQRKLNLMMVKNLSQKSLKNMGKANNLPLSTRAILWIVAGHELHHLNILREKYLV